MATSKPALVIADELATEIVARTGLTAVQSLDSDGNPLILVGTEADKGPGGRIKVKPITFVTYDVLGLASTIFGPHEILIGFEADGVTTGSYDPCTTTAQRFLIAAAAVSMGCTVKLYESSFGDFFDVADFVDAKLVATFDKQSKYPLGGV